jgi:acyl-CoA synthetase (AMP-forming)/AMP-acid ligase II
VIEVLAAVDAEGRQRRIAGGLLARGLTAGDRIAFATGDSVAMLCAVLGALRVGIIPVVLNAALLPHERAELLADAEPTLVVDEALLVALDGGTPAELAAVPLSRPMLYTSGTSGRPKGVWSPVLSERDAQALFDEEQEIWAFARDDVHLVCSPLHHSAPIRFSAGTLLSGGTIVVLDRFTAEGAVAATREHQPTTAFMVPAHLHRLLMGAGAPDRATLSSFRLLAHAGSACPASIKHAALDAFPTGSVWEFYGSTEGQFTVCSTDEWLERPGTVGRARPHRALEIADDDTIWCAVPPYARFRYWNDDARTEAAWRPSRDPDDQTRSGAAFSVGDLGRLDADGYLFIDGRRDDLVISGGVNVYPAEVESVLIRAPGVEQVAVFGVADDRWGQRVCAAVVGEARPDELLAFAREHLAAYKVPKTVYPLDELPHTSTGKVRRLALPDHLGLV